MQNNTTYISMHDYGTSFIGGFLLSVFGNVSWIWSLQLMPMSSHDAMVYAAGFALKIFATLILGIIGGLAGLIGRDLYNFFKRKKK
jgi:hypothetical protein